MRRVPISFYGFVSIHPGLTSLPFCPQDMERFLEESASSEDHTDADCIFVAVLSHGEMGILYASDQPYKPDRLWSHFNAERCPTLAGKPKLFFIQACQGDQLDGGVSLKPVSTETDSRALSYKIPSHADFLVLYFVRGFMQHHFPWLFYLINLSSENRPNCNSH